MNTKQLKIIEDAAKASFVLKYLGSAILSGGNTTSYGAFENGCPVITPKKCEDSLIELEYTFRNGEPALIREKML